MQAYACPPPSPRPPGSPISRRHSSDNPTPHVLIEGENAAPLEVVGGTWRESDKLVLIMVGLPATGKTHIAKRICRFFSFFHDIPTQIFNVGDYRRQLCGAKQSASFYDHSNAEALAQRTMACNAALNDTIEYMRQDGVRIAIFDATNSIKERRDHIAASLAEAGIGPNKIIFLESICDDEALLEESIRTVKASTPDYRGVDEEEAVADFHKRRKQYMDVYETLDESDSNKAYIKVINCKQFVVNSIRGHLALKVVHFIMNLHTSPRTFYLTRHGQSGYNLLGKIGGDAGLSDSGLEYARRLARYAEEHIGSHTVVDAEGSEVKKTRPARLWTSTMRRTNETAQFIEHTEIGPDDEDYGGWVNFRPTARRNLDELYAGSCDGMTYAEIEEVYPDEFKRRQKDKLAYRYPRGESYMDVILRLEPLAHEMERTREPVLIVGHQGILRILYAYFMGLTREEAPYVSIPLNHVIQLTPHAYGCHEKRVCLMNKKEMLSDGQDEPVTSMPTLQMSVEGLAEMAGDPVLNAPSC